MTPLEAVVSTNTKDFGHTAQDAVDAFYQEIEKGIQCMKNGEVYTIEEAWEEIDKI